MRIVVLSCPALDRLNLWFLECCFGGGLKSNQNALGYYCTHKHNFLCLLLHKQKLLLYIFYNYQYIIYYIIILLLYNYYNYYSCLGLQLGKLLIIPTSRIIYTVSCRSVCFSIYKWLLLFIMVRLLIGVVLV